MQKRLSAKLALWASVGLTFCGLAPSASAVTVYNRTAAVAYANKYWNKVVSDGYFWINGSTATNYGAGQPVPTGSGVAGGVGDDCAHYVSSVLGSEPHEKGGGLTIPNRAGTYGEPGAARLDELLVGNSAGGYGTTYKYGQLVSSVSQLTPGDVIGYDWNGSGGGSMSGIDHTVVYVGNGKVDAHAASHLSADWTLGGAAYYFFIHITLPDSIVPTTPINLSPAANTFTTDITPTLTANAFVDGAPGSTHAAAQWQIYNSLGSLTYDTGTDTSHLTSLTVPDGMLNIGATYSWKVRYQDSYGSWSSYSTATSLSIGIDGDYNHDSVVDSADYAIWRNDSASNGGADGYNAWRSHFGMTMAGGMALNSAEAPAAVPEPAALSLLILVAVGAGARQRRRDDQSQNSPAG